MSKTKAGTHHRIAVGPHFNEGARQIWLRLEDLKVTASEFEKSKGWRRGALFKYMHGDQRPNRAWSEILREALDIDPSLYDQKPARAFSLPSRKAA